MSNGTSKKATPKTGGAIGKANSVSYPVKSNSDPRIKGGRPGHINGSK